MERAGKCMNHWINVVHCTSNNSVLGRGNLHYALQCMKGGLIGGRHDDYCNDLGLVAGQAYSPSSIYDDPKEVPVTTTTKQDKEKDGALLLGYQSRNLFYFYRS
eukprot:79979-Ditylum_brightwellii.AAC.2